MAHGQVRVRLRQGGELELGRYAWWAFLKSFRRGYEDLPGVKAVQLGSPAIVVRPRARP